MKGKFDTGVQELKYNVLKEVANSAWEGTLKDDLYAIPKRVIPGPKANYRCCIYKERAIVEERVQVAMGGDRDFSNTIQIVKIACDECPLSGYEVTDMCRGCISHRCINACPRNTIEFDPITKKARIEKSKCINCGMCARACQYSAIVNRVRPCEAACKVKAIHAGADMAAEIDYNKCVSCGACVYACPFGAPQDKSQIVDVINLLKESDNGKNFNVYACVAPAIASQFRPVSLGKMASAIKALGFSKVVEAALGADMVTKSETHELIEHGSLTSSCCPTFVGFIEKYFPELKDKISTSLSPQATIARYVKEKDPTAKVVFVGPCITKKKEITRDNYKNTTDLVLTFEEMKALLDSRSIDPATFEEAEMDLVSPFGRGFAKCGGLSEAVTEMLKEEGSDFVLKGVAVDGLDNCKAMLTKMKAGTADFNFLEGMGCIGGCIGGPGCLTHELRDKMDVDRVAKTAKAATIKDSLKDL